MPMTYNEYLIALEAEIVVINDEKESKFSKIKEKMITAIQTAWDKFVEFVKNTVTKIKTGFSKIKINSANKILLRNSDFKELKFYREEFKENIEKETYEQLKNELKKRKLQIASTVVGTLISSIVILVTVIEKFESNVKTLNLTNDRVVLAGDRTLYNKYQDDLINKEFDIDDSNTEWILQNYGGKNINFKPLNTVKDFHNEIYDSTQTAFNKYQANVFSRDRINEYYDYQYKIEGAICKSIIVGSLAVIISEIKNADKGIKLLKKVIKDEDLSIDQIRLINEIITKYKKISTKELELIYNSKVII